MRLDVLGSSGSHTGPDSVCSGYLLRTQGATILVDAGNGSTARLQGLVELVDLDAVVISHRHVDHCADLIGMHHALRSIGGGGIPLYAPAGVREVLATVAGQEAPYDFRDSFTPHEVTAGDRVTIGDVTAVFHHAVHTVPAVSVRFDDGRTDLVYSGDTAGGEELLTAARGATAFLCEATWQGDIEAYPPGIHLTARDAGRHATQAAVGRLLLTHVAGLLDRDVTRAEAGETFAGRLDVVRDGDVYEL